MEKLKPGICGVCDITPLFIIDPRTGKRRVSDDYTEITLALSDESIARHGICKNCINNLDDQKVELLLERIKLSWADEMVGWGTDTQFNQMRSIELHTWDEQEHEALRKAKVVREDKRLEKIARVKQQKEKGKDKNGLK